MQLTKITIAKNPSYINGGKGYTASCVVQGGQDYPADINVQIPDELLEGVTAMIAQLVADRMAEATKLFQADVQASLAGPVIEQTLIEGAAQ
jgi:hypothetical protein